MLKNEQIPIGRFSLFTQLTQKALRLYDKKGLLKPQIRSITGYRYYSISQIEKGIKIKYLSKIGFGLSEINEILIASEKGDNKKIKELLSKRLSEVQIEIQQLKKIEELLIQNHSLELLYLNTDAPKIKRIPSIRIIARREIGTYGVTIPKLIDELMKQIYKPENQRVFVSITGAPMFIAHDSSYKEKGADIEVGIPISGRITVDDNFEVKNLLDGPVVSVHYHGPFNGISEAYNRGFDYIVKNKFKIRDHTREIYLSTPEESLINDQLIEIQIPIEEESDV